MKIRVGNNIGQLQIVDAKEAEELILKAVSELENGSEPSTTLVVNKKEANDGSYIVEVGKVVNKTNNPPSGYSLNKIKRGNPLLKAIDALQNILMNDSKN